MLNASLICASGSAVEKQEYLCTPPYVSWFMGTCENQLPFEALQYHELKVATEEKYMELNYGQIINTVTCVASQPHCLYLGSWVNLHIYQ